MWKLEHEKKNDNDNNIFQKKMTHLQQNIPSFFYNGSDIGVPFFFATTVIYLKCLETLFLCQFFEVTKVWQSLFKLFSF